ncbi:hypothetical protein BDZ94DRAFT_533399 [Collybia nuda]|uniref:Uncharacterized protein n=1 Tax=Collybia nuda TaxID=64659 RepID=A0A9P5Y8A2_9AGAR|nr:hypothetical protein BDZ94DRAFT_533399 [Collybia nuda]
MKLFYSILSLVAVTSATIVYPSEGTNCSPTIAAVSSCGNTGLANYNVRSARVNFEKATARFYRNHDCTGVFLSYASDQTCVKFTQWSPKCVKIFGGTC